MLGTHHLPEPFNHEEEVSKIVVHLQPEEGMIDLVVILTILVAGTTATTTEDVSLDIETTELTSNVIQLTNQLSRSQVHRPDSIEMSTDNPNQTEMTDNPNQKEPNDNPNQKKPNDNPSQKEPNDNPKNQPKRQPEVELVSTSIDTTKFLSR